MSGRVRVREFSCKFVMCVHGHGKFQKSSPNLTRYIAAGKCVAWRYARRESYTNIHYGSCVNCKRICSFRRISFFFFFWRFNSINFFFSPVNIVLVFIGVFGGKGLGVRPSGVSVGPWSFPGEAPVDNRPGGRTSLGRLNYTW